jgi:superfamily II DNA or RNA helicase
VICDGFAEIGRRARKEGLSRALRQPLGTLLDSAPLSSTQIRTFERTAEALRLRSIRDLCRPEVDAYVERSFGRRVLRNAVDALAAWLTDYQDRFAESDDFDEPDLDDVDLDDLDEGADEPFDLFTSQALRLASRTGTGLPPPPANLAALRQWAVQHGVLERLADPAPAVPPGFPGGAPPGAPATIEEVLTAAVPERPRGARMRGGHWVTRMRRDAAAALLVRFAENLAVLRDRRRQGEGKVVAVDPVFAGLQRALEATRAALGDGAVAAHRCEGAVIPAPLRFHEDPARLVYDEGDSPRDQVLLGYREPSLVTIELTGWQSGHLSVVCRCSEARRGCPHPLAALEAVSDLLGDPSSPAYRPLREFLATPGWTRFLARLDRALAVLPSRDGGADERLVWRLARGEAGTQSLEPHLQKKTAQGAWSRGTRISMSQLAGRSALWAAAADARAVEILAAGIDAGMYLPPRAIPGRVFRALEALAGAGNVFLAERRDAPVSIQVVTPRLRFCRPDGTCTPAARGEATVALRLALGDQVVEPDQLLARAPDGRHYVDPDPAANVCRLARIEPEVAALAQAFAAEPVGFPDDSLQEVLRRIDRIERVAGVDLPVELRGRTVAADARLICRLTPIADDGLRVEVRVRPLAGANECPPGEGPRVLVGTRDGERVSAERALETEREAALRLVAEIGLAGAAPGRSWSFEILDGGQALTLLLALRERVSETTIEWPADSWRIDQVRRSSLRLRVTQRRDWFGVEGGVEIDGQLVPLAALLEAVRRGCAYVVLGPRRFVVIEEELRRRLLAVEHVLHQGRSGIEIGAPAAEAVADLVDDPRSLEAIPSFHELRERLLRAARREPVVPSALAATLRPYQVDGFRWLSRLAEGGAGGCLADDMGLGKTVQVLAVLLERMAAGPALVVAPTSVVPNWMAEAGRFVPSLRLVLYRGAGRPACLAGLGPGDLVVTSYALAVRDAEALGAVRFAALVLDEAQALKNAATRRARAIRELQADWRVALTGTPIENHLGELWSLFRVVSPALLGSWEQFRERFALPIERQTDGARRRGLARLLQPFLLRRTKEAVAPELPAKTEVQRLVDLSAGERRLYEQTRIAALAALGQAGPDQEGAREGQARIQILAALTRLRQLACHARLGDADSRLSSSKVRALVEILNEVREAGHRALIFSQFTRFLDLVREELAAEGFRLLGLDGSTPAEAREVRVAAFQRGEADAFLISLRAGGTGLNLTAADYVIHLDPWWNPAVEDQATDRAHRIGQTKAVTVVRLIARGTVEEAVLALHEEKRGLAASILDGTDTAARLGAEELLALLRARADDDAEEDSAAGADEEEPATEPGEDESAPDGPDGDAPPSLPDDLARLDSLIALALAPFLRQGDEARSATYRAYERSLAGFRSYVAQGRPAVGASLEACIESYLGALEGGEWPAPRSALGVARATLNHLRRVAAARPDPVQAP